ncbi:MAG: MFS transporter [Bacteroidia bacterium]|nr:MFS transporter [Bacteroidia bacterium]
MNNSKATRLFAVLVSVFFFWGFVAASNDILIPVFKDKLQLSQGKSQMIAFAFYVAYTLGSLIYLGMIKFLNFDLIKKWGFGKGIAVGLFISTLGTLLFIPAADNASFELLLGGLIVVGIGFSFQQTAANPLAILLGSPETGSQRLSMAGGINNLGTTVGPLLVSFAVFGEMGSGGATSMDISAVKIPYMVLGALFLLFGFIFWNLKTNQDEESNDASAAESGEVRSALSYPQLWMGMIAIFLYVGVEVSTASNLPEFMKQQLNFKTDEMAPYISLFWASLMIGRWTSAASAFNISRTMKQVMRFVLPFIAFGIFLGVNLIAGKDVSVFYNYFALIFVLIALDFASKGNPANQLFIYSVAAIVMLIIGIFSGGTVGMFAFISVGLFCSTLWPCIFTLSIAGLGRSTGQGSNFLIMMIMGGGFVSVLQGNLSESIGISQSYWVGVLCFVYLAFYALTTKRNLAKQGVEIGPVAGGH